MTLLRKYGRITRLAAVGDGMDIGIEKKPWALVGFLEETSDEGERRLGSERASE